VPGVIGIIPARLESVRFPAKALADETGLPLIIHVAKSAAACNRLERILIASDADSILQAARDHGFEACRTGSEHPNGTSRIAEVVDSMDADLVVNIQADEPEISPEVIEAGITALEDAPDCQVGTIAAPLSPSDDACDPNIVKVVLDNANRAMYFSRSGIPFDRDDSGNRDRLRHVGLYVYRREFLSVYAGLEPTPAEELEKLEQLRILEHGYRIAVGIHDCSHVGIDTPEQYQAFVERFRRSNS